MYNISGDIISDRCDSEYILKRLNSSYYKKSKILNLKTNQKWQR